MIKFQDHIPGVAKKPKNLREVFTFDFTVTLRGNGSETEHEGSKMAGKREDTGGRKSHRQSDQDVIDENGYEDQMVPDFSDDEDYVDDISDEGKLVRSHNLHFVFVTQQSLWRAVRSICSDTFMLSGTFVQKTVQLGILFSV